VRATVPRYYRWIEAYGGRLHLPRQWISKAITADLDADQARSAAVVRLAALGTNAWSVAPALTDSVAKGDLSIGMHAALALAGMKIEQSPDWPRLAGRLADQTQAVRVLEWLDHKLVSIRTVALDGLAQMGSAAHSSAPVLERLTTDENATIRQAATNALRRITERSGKPPPDTTM
jgi:HEAT repeat protein